MAASSDFHFYEKMFSKLTTSLTTYVNDTATQVIATITPVATTLLIIYVMLWGWSMMRGMIQEPVMDGVGRIIRLSLITGIALGIGNYNQFLSDWLWSAPDALASVVGGASSSSTSNIQFLDGLMSKMYDYGAAFYEAAMADTTFGIPDPGKLVAAIIIWFAGIAVTGYGAFLYALSKMALAVLLAIGPMFVLLMIFEPTKKFFDAWIGQVLNYVFSIMLTAAATGLILTIIKAFLASPDAIANMADTEIAGIIPAVVFSLIGLLVLMQVSSIASALGGGVAIGTLGAVGALYGKTKNTLGSGVNVASGKTLSDLRGARRAKQNNAKWAENNPGMARRAAGAPMAAYRKITGGRKNRVQKG